MFNALVVDNNLLDLLMLAIEENAVVVADGTANKKNAVKLENLSLMPWILLQVLLD